MLTMVENWINIWWLDVLQLREVRIHLRWQYGRLTTPSIHLHPLLHPSYIVQF